MGLTVCETIWEVAQLATREGNERVIPDGGSQLVRDALNHLQHDAVQPYRLSAFCIFQPHHGSSYK